MSTADELLARIRSLPSIAFESPTRGAVCLSRLSWGLPPSEQIAGLDDAQRAFDAIRRTVQHPHRFERWLDQFGAGEYLELSREVTEGTARWTFTVTVLVRTDGTVVVEDANVVRPDDDEVGADDADGADGDHGEDDDEIDAESAGARRADAAGGSDAAGREVAAPLGMHACPCCGHATLGERGGFLICPVCFWEDDGQDNLDVDVARGGPNRVSLREGRKSFHRIGASVEADLPHVRRPTREEVRLRTFDADGNERG